MKFGMISLGCAKNRVDSEEILSLLIKNNYELTLNPNEADFLIVNTCGFIEDAKKESIEAIFDALSYHKITVVVGCLAQRYEEELKKEIPEIDLIVSIRNYDKFPQLLENVLKQKVEGKITRGDRYLSTPSYTAFLKISEGCNNCCAYCAIPLIRGSFHSYKMEDLLFEAKNLVSNGVKEIVVISQDTTRYGEDLNPRVNIVDLLKELLKIEGVEFIRLLYLYPDEVSDELIDLIASDERLTSYFDLPIQHCSDVVLKAMRRRGGQKEIREVISRIRNKIPNAILRTTLIVGFPFEGEKEFNELVAFIKEIQFDHLGVFTYSVEEGTIGATFLNQIDEETKIERKEKIMKVQRRISFKKNRAHIGENMRGIVLGFDDKKMAYLVRSGWNAPDEIDGNIYVYSTCPLNDGDIIDFKVVDSQEYDLYGEV